MSAQKLLNIFLIVYLVRFAVPHVINLARDVSSSFPQVTQSQLIASSVLSDLLPLEPVTVRLTARHGTPHPLRGVVVLDFSAGRVAASVRQPNGSVVEVKQPSAGNVLTRPVPERIFPGESNTRLETLASDLDTLFPAAGDYQVSFRLMDLSGRAAGASNALKVRVRSPEGPDRAAYDHIRLSPIRGSFFAVADTGQLQQVVTLFPQSRYAGRALITLAQRAQALQDFAHAIELLKAASKPGSPLSYEAAERLSDPAFRARRR